MKKILKVLVTVAVFGILGTAMYTFMPVISTGPEVRGQVRDQVQYIHKKNRGRRLQKEVQKALANITVPGRIEDVYSNNNNGKITVSFTFYRIIKFRDIKITEKKFDIVVENVQMSSF